MTKDHQGMVDELLDLFSGLSDWEMEFLDSIDKKRAKSDLTPKQAQILKKLWDKMFVEQ